MFYVCLLYSLMIIREKPAIITYMCTYTYVYDEKKRRLAIEIVDTTKDRILFLEGDKQPTFAYW